MDPKNIKIYRYRWMILLAYMSVIIMNQLMWITFAPITSEAARFFGVSDLSIGLLSLSFMVVYIFISIPASWIIDTLGFRIAVGTGAVLTGLFGITRGMFANDFMLVLVSQIGIAIGQPFILNAMTKVAARWFPMSERASVTGLSSLAMYFGIVIGLALTPFLLIRFGMKEMLMLYGFFSLASLALFISFVREKPPTPACPPELEERSLVYDGLKATLKNRNFLLLLVIFFFGLGVFNAVTTWIEDIVRPRGFSITQAGITGGLMVIGGVVGAAILPSFSDKYRKRVPFILASLGFSTLGLVGIAYATTYGLLLVVSFVMGFFLLSAGPIGFQYGAEIAYPAPEGTTTGLLLMAGQVSGILFIFGMDLLKSPATGSMTLPMIFLILFMVAGFILATRLKESGLLTGK